MPQLALPSSSSSGNPAWNPLWVSAGAMMLFALTRGSTRAAFAIAATTGVLAYRTAQARALANEYEAETSFLLNTSPEQAYALWRNFEHLPRFMSHLKSVRVLDDRRSEWVAKGPLGCEVSWRAEITEDRPNERIAWQSLPDAEVQNSGSVTFARQAQGRGAVISAKVRYSLPLGSAGKALITVLGSSPEFMLREDVRRFKSLLEAGEAPTVAGQSHGPRGLTGKIERVLFRETTNHSEPQAAYPEPQAGASESQAQFQTA